MQILVVEDNPVNQKLVVFMLEKLGYTLTLAGDGIEAIEQAEQQAFDLIFMDLHMPRMDGIEASKRILKSQPELQIVPLTANVSEDSQKACKSAGMTGFIAKPYSIDQLCKAIQRAFEAKS
jgi:CheY-like chemotaxis protein